MPSKFCGIAAAGRPTIFIGAKDGEIGRMLKENGCGFTVAPGDGEALTERILALAGDRDLCASLGVRGRMAFERQWDKEQALAQGEALLQPWVIPISVSHQASSTRHLGRDSKKRVSCMVLGNVCFTPR